MISSTNNKGFQLTFSNGYTISIQFGMGNYCKNRRDKNMIPTGLYSCKDAEIAYWHENSETEMHIKSHCSANEVAEWINKVSNFSPVNN